MHGKLYKLRSGTAQQGKAAFINLDLEFDGQRAFVIWDSLAVGNYMLKARVEIDPRLLQADSRREADFVYRGELVLPRPENNYPAR